MGIGTNTPTRPLHVTRADGTARILVQDTSASTARRFLMDRENNGPTGMHFTNSDSLASWEFANAGADNFVLSLVGSGGNEFNLLNNGRLLIGPGNQAVFDLKPNGDLRVNGSDVRFDAIRVPSGGVKVDLDQRVGGPVDTAAVLGT